MACHFRTVVVKQLPDTENEEQEWAFLQQLRSSLQVDRPRIVLNCSGIQTFGPSSLHLLLCCLEEAMKRNGDVRLSSVPKAAFAVLEASSIHRLFKIFEDDADAMRSFQRLPVFSIPEPELRVEEISVPLDTVAMEMMPEAAEDAA